MSVSASAAWRLAWALAEFRFLVVVALAEFRFLVVALAEFRFLVVPLFGCCSC